MRRSWLCVRIGLLVVLGACTATTTQAAPVARTGGSGVVSPSAVQLVERPFPAYGFTASFPVIPGVSQVQSGPASCSGYGCVYNQNGFVVRAFLAASSAHPPAYCRTADAAVAPRGCPATIEGYLVAVFTVPGWAGAPGSAMSVAERWMNCPGYVDTSFHGLAAIQCLGATGPDVIMLIHRRRLYILCAAGRYVSEFYAGVRIQLPPQWAQDARAGLPHGSPAILYDLGTQV